TGRLAVFFGDTWASGGEGCEYPVFPSDDLEASLPTARPEVLDRGPPESASACKSLSIARSDPKDATSWKRIRLFPSLTAKATDRPLETGALRTPVAAFSSGETDFVLYYRGETHPCKDSSDCSTGLSCSTEPAASGRRLGICSHPHAAAGSTFS